MQYAAFVQRGITGGPRLNRRRASRSCAGQRTYCIERKTQAVDEHEHTYRNFITRAETTRLLTLAKTLRFGARDQPRRGGDRDFISRSRFWCHGQNSRIRNTHPQLVIFFWNIDESKCAGLPSVDADLKNELSPLHTCILEIIRRHVIYYNFWSASNWIRLELTPAEVTNFGPLSAEVPDIKYTFA